jgi:hypothetical protein
MGETQTWLSTHVPFYEAGESPYSVFKPCSDGSRLRDSSCQEQLPLEAGSCSLAQDPRVKASHYEMHGEDNLLQVVDFRSMKHLQNL